MLKNIIIGDKQFTLKSSAYTPFAYRDLTGRELLKDLKRLQRMDVANEDEQLENYGEIVMIVEQLAYVMYQQANKDKLTFEEFLQEIDYVSQDLIVEVVGLAMSTFR